MYTVKTKYAKVTFRYRWFALRAVKYAIKRKQGVAIEYSAPKTLEDK